LKANDLRDQLTTVAAENILVLQTTGDAQLLGDFARRWLTPQASAEHVEL